MISLSLTVYAAVDMNHIVKTTQYMNNGIGTGYCPELVVKPSPLLAPLPGRQCQSTISTVVGTTLFGFTSFSSFDQALIGNRYYTNIWPNGTKRKFAAWAFALLSALNKVDFPTFGNPTIPACKAILSCKFYC